MSNPYEGDSSVANTPGIKGTNTATGLVLPGEVLYVGVWGSSAGGRGVLGEGITGVEGISTTGTGFGVRGECKGTRAGVEGTSSGGDGVNGESQSNQHAGVSANNTNGGYGLWAKSLGSNPGTGGIAGYFNSDGNFAIQAVCTADVDAVNVTSNSPNHAALSGWNNSGGFGLWAVSDQATGPVGGVGVYGRGAKYAAQFDGNVQVNGVLTAKQDVVVGSDCAEDFDVASAAEIDPGTVMVLSEGGALKPSESAYDRRVAGVISGAGDYQPGLILGRGDSSHERMPLALVGKVYCKVDATYGTIEVGDLLTTSPTPGHAMKASDPVKAFGSVLGKALRPLHTGLGLIPVLVSLQ
jgi:hypothetical protein